MEHALGDAAASGIALAGRRYRESIRVEIRPLAAGQPLPWAQTGRLRAKDYMDTLD